MTDPWTDVLGFTDLSSDERKENIAEVKQLIRSLGDEHPEIFDSKGIDPEDYQREWVDAVHSLGGVTRQLHGSDSEDIVKDILLEPAEENGYLTYEDQSGDERIDFKGRLTKTNNAFALDVKGGEGQSIGHLLVPGNTDILTFWMERHSTNTKPPGSRLNEVINRVVRWGINHNENPSYIVNHDEPAGARTDDGDVIPDVIVFPEQYPSPDVPNPSMPSLDELHFAEVVFDTLIGTSDLEESVVKKHIWWHELEYIPDGRKVGKNIYNAYDNDISLRTRAIDFERISEVT